jgi:hypothetical protein
MRHACAVGVYENAKFAYLHDTLIGRRGIPAVLAILLEEVCQRLLRAGAIDFAVRVDCPSLDRCPLPFSLLLISHGSNQACIMHEMMKFEISTFTSPNSGCTQQLWTLHGTEEHNRCGS